MNYVRSLLIFTVLTGTTLIAACSFDSAVAPDDRGKAVVGMRDPALISPASPRLWYANCETLIQSGRPRKRQGVGTASDIQDLNVVVIQAKRGWLPSNLFTWTTWDYQCASQGGGGGGSPPPANGENDAELCEAIQIDVNELIAETGGTADGMEACPDCLIDIVALLADWHDIRTNGLNCANGLAAAVDVIAAIVPGVPAVFGSVERGARNAVIREALRRGREAHAAFRASIRAAGDMAEVVLPSRKRIDAVIVDHVNRVVTLIELKPRTRRAGILGELQVAEYADEVSRLSELRSGSRVENIQGYRIIPKVEFYDIDWSLPW